MWEEKQTVLLVQLVACAGLPVIRKMPPISAVAGEQLAVTCPAAGFPIHAVTWEKGKTIH